MALLARNRNFRLLFSASAVSNLGDGVSALAFPWLATLLTRDAFMISLVLFATRLPWFLFAIPAGVLVDRCDRRVLMVQADVFRLLLTGGVIAMVLSLPALPPEGSGVPYVLGLAVLAFLLGAAEVVRDNAAQTVLPQLVAGDDLERANGQLWSVEQVMGAFVGPPLAGVLIALAVPAPFALDAATFGVAAWCLWLIALPPRPRGGARRIWPEVVEGWRWMRSHVLLLRFAVVLGLINALHVMAFTVLVLLSQEGLGLGATGYGLLLAAGATGAVLAGVAGPPVVARLGPQRAVLLGLWMMPLPYLLIGLTSSAVVAGAALMAQAVASMLWNLVTVSWRQRVIPEALLGRVNALYRFFGWGMMPLGALAGGALVSLSEPVIGREMALRLPYVFVAFSLFALCLYGSRKLRF
ncbi:MFS transporter [Vannielia sp.]|uniref:MFS transporter n=1 Tax=Vannielia sp. TaxID=2813045 RepID=UPI0026166B91|nr:MFS transporter [Vannielia sp.]MDF1873520.1 MFS transporter [Vannielia sp.]